MPTLEEVRELLNNCTFMYGTYNGVEGDYVTGPNGNSIFLPFAGYRYLDDLDYEGSYGNFWSGTYYIDNGAYYLHCSKGHGHGTWYDHENRIYGCTVRPVTEK